MGDSDGRIRTSYNLRQRSSPPLAPSSACTAKKLTTSRRKEKPRRRSSARTSSAQTCASNANKKDRPCQKRKREASNANKKDRPCQKRKREEAAPSRSLRAIRNVKRKSRRMTDNTCMDSLYEKNIIMNGISQGEENKQIPVVNTIDDEHPMAFKYLKAMMYNPQHISPSPRGCDCINGCTDSESCACAVKNGGELAFNENGEIVEERPLVYECGPSCKCPQSCCNRVSQHGIKFRLEVFKTELRGWGVRSRDYIPSGGFVCEYTGLLVDDRAADEWTNDEYLFDIGDYLTDVPSEDDDVAFAVDALEYGSVGRFLNHSCSPNVFAQSILFDHDNKKVSRQDVLKLVIFHSYDL